MNRPSPPTPPSHAAPSADTPSDPAPHPHAAPPALATSNAPALPVPALPDWRPIGDARVAHLEWLDAAASLSRAGVSLDLVYVDPPFNTGQTQSDRAGAYADRFGDTAAYIAWLTPRVRASLALLKPTGSILLHVDWRTSHRVRVMLDELLGEDRFVNHLIWSYGLGGSSPRRFARKHDDILFYSVHPDRYWFDPPRVPATSARMRGLTKKATDVLFIPPDDLDIAPPAAASNSSSSDPNALPSPPHDVLNVPTLNNMARERVGYPTQKPLALLDLLIRACCPPAGVVWDPCCGSGTTPLAATRARRTAFASDANPEAIALTEQRLADSVARASSSH